MTEEKSERGWGGDEGVTEEKSERGWGGMKE